MERILFYSLPYLLLLLPPAFVATASLAWWRALRQPWLFVIIGTVFLYIVAGVIASKVFGNIGIAGVASPSAGLSSGAGLKPLLRSAFVGLLVFAGVAALSLWCVRQLLAKD
jgi:hypothetical protein